MKVLKFGGTSVANSQNIKKVKSIVEISSKKNKVIVVVSALAGVTDLLLNAAKHAADKIVSYNNFVSEIQNRHYSVIKELIPILDQSKVIAKVKIELNELETLLEGAYLIGEITPKLSDKIVSYGELLSSVILFEYFVSEELNAEREDARGIIKTNDDFQNAIVNFKQTNALCQKKLLKQDANIIVVPGFVASSVNGNNTTLGRGGSDYTAAIIAAAINANILEIWTDVSGMYTANPTLVKQACSIEYISYEEAMELSHFGAKVLYPPTIHPVLQKKIPIVIKNTFDSEKKGTLIADSNPNNDDNNNKVVKGISHVSDISLISLEGIGMVGITGVSKRLFESLSIHKINIILITQASSEHSICIGIETLNATKAVAVINDEFEFEISKKNINTVISEDNLSIVALVGDKMKSHQGLSGKMFSTLGKNNVNIRAIAQGASEKNISVVINNGDVKKVLNTLHESFFEDHIKQLNLFVMGVGNVGEKFIEQIAQQQTYLKENLKLNVRIIGISNSRTMIFNKDGINLCNWKVQLSKGQKADSNQFFKNNKNLNLRNSIFIDNTASEFVANLYEQYLQESIAVVTCNKIAASSSSLVKYKDLKKLAIKYNAPFLFETNVGAGLPILDTLKNLIASGDKVIKIQAVLSGSLNYIFNNFKKDTSFSQVVSQAQKEGFTEPDPKIDLSGKDVARKILILARECGLDIEFNEVENKSFLPAECLETNNNIDFYNSLIKREQHFVKLYNAANDKGCKLKYVAQLENYKASVGLQHIYEGHDFYNLQGSDNIVLFFTERYAKQPLIIKGAGAGADVTASGIFADVIRIGNF